MRRRRKRRRRRRRKSMLGPCWCCLLSYLFSVSGYHRTHLTESLGELQERTRPIGHRCLLSQEQGEHMCRPAFPSAPHQLTGRHGETTGAASLFAPFRKWHCHLPSLPRTSHRSHPGIPPFSLLYNQFFSMCYLF